MKKIHKIFLWSVVTIAVLVAALAAAWMIGRKTGAEETSASIAAYTLLNQYKTETETLSKTFFEKRFTNGAEIFDWLMKNDAFEEKEGDEGHPRYVSPELKTSLMKTYPDAYERIVRLLQKAQSSRHEFIVKSSEISSNMSNKAIEALKRKDLKEALRDCKIAMDIFPMNAKPYILLTKLYLMTGQEQNMFEILSLAGRSYPNFNNIIDIIDDQDLSQIPLEEPQDNIYLANFPKNKKTAVSFLFDDGEKNVYTNALPSFEKYGFKATIPVVAGMVAENDHDPFWGSWHDWKDAADRGFEIANHSMYHRDSIKLHGSDFDVAIDQSKELIERQTGRQVTAYVFPHDSYNDEAVGRALRTHEVVRSWEFLSHTYNKAVGITYGGPFFSIESANRLIDIAVQRQLWLIANCHGVTKKHGLLSFKSITPDFLESHLAYIHSRSNDIWVDTFSHVFEYMDLRHRTIIETKSYSEGSADFILRNDSPGKKILFPVTVILKTQNEAITASSHSSEGRKLLTWSCGSNKLCVDVDSFNENIHVEWGNGQNP